MISSSRIEDLKDLAIPAKKHLIDGKSVANADSEVLDVLSPRDGESLTTIAAGGVTEIDWAASSARRSFERGVWAQMAPAGRKKILI